MRAYHFRIVWTLILLAENPGCHEHTVIRSKSLAFVRIEIRYQHSVRTRQITSRPQTVVEAILHEELDRVLGWDNVTPEVRVVAARPVPSQPYRTS